jgi:ferredoxin
VVKVSVNWGLCDSQGVCTVNCPEVFYLDDNDELQLLMEEPPDELRPKVEAAVRKCPKAAISLT